MSENLCPALILEDAAKRADQQIATRAERLAVAKDDLKQFEQNMGHVALADDPNVIAVILAAKKEAVNVATAALEAATPILDPKALWRRQNPLLRGHPMSRWIPHEPKV